MSMPRDGGDPEETYAEARPRGRAVPEREALAIVIRVGDLEVGSVNLRTLKGRAQFDLEDAITSPTPATRLLTWLTTYAGLSQRDLPRVREELAEMEIHGIVDLLQDISEAIGRGMQLPNGSRRR